MCSKDESAKFRDVLKDVSKAGHKKERKRKGKKKVVPSDMSGQTPVMKYGEVVTIERILDDSQQNQRQLRRPIIMITRAKSF